MSTVDYTKMHFLTLSLLDANEPRRFYASKQVLSALSHFFQPYIPAECIDDAIQDTLTIAWKKRSALRPDANAFRFLLGIARNVKMKYRDQLAKRNQQNASDGIFQKVSTNEWPHDERIAFILDYSKNILEEIPFKCWQLTKEQGYTTAEVAERLNIPSGTVKFFVHKVRHYLRSKLREWEIT